MTSTTGRITLFPSFAGLRDSSLLLRTIAQITRNRLATVSLGLVLLLALVALLAPVITPYDPLALDKTANLQAPSFDHLLGTDQRGRDIFSRLIYASRISLAVGVAAVTLSTVVGVPVGLVAGYFRGTTDTILMRILDALLAFPPILLAMAIVTILGPGSTNAMIAVAVTGIPIFARLARASTLSQVGLDYVTAARAIGAGPWRIIFRSILPNAFAPILVQMSLAVAYAILLEAALSFFGLGTQPPTPSWGAMLSEARGYLHHAPWYAIAPGVVITVLVLALNTFTDGLRDALDPSHQH